VNRNIFLGNAAFFTGGNAPTSAGNGVPNSYVLGGNSVSASSLGGNVAVSISVADKLLNITQATGGGFTLAGTIAPNADVTGLLNVEINAQQGLSAGSNSGNYLFSANAGTVILTGANAYDGTTTVTQGSLLIDGDQSGATGAVTVKSSAFLGGNGASGGDVTTQSGAGLTTRVRDWTGAAGVGFDDLSVGAFNAGSVPINLKIETAGIVNFSETAKSFTILNTTGITNFNPANVTITAPGFTGTGTWSLAQSGTSLVLSYAAVSSSAYDTWISQGAFNTPPLSAADKLPGADPDGDGRSNILEFALNGNPVNSSNSGLIASLIQNSSGAATNELTLVAAVRDGATFASGPNGVQIAAVAGITYTIEGSLNLVFPASAVSTTGPSNTAPGATGLPSLAGTDWEYRTFKLDASEGLAGKGFLRLKVTQP
jgi:autotransporter-associated beta strand protein